MNTELNTLIAAMTAEESCAVDRERAVADGIPATARHR